MADLLLFTAAIVSNMDFRYPVLHSIKRTSISTKPKKPSSSRQGNRRSRGIGSDKSQDTKKAVMYCPTLRVLAPYWNESFWHTPYRVAWLNSTQTPESRSP